MRATGLLGGPVVLDNFDALVSLRALVAKAGASWICFKELLMRRLTRPPNSPSGQTLPRSLGPNRQRDTSAVRMTATGMTLGEKTSAKTAVAPYKGTEVGSR